MPRGSSFLGTRSHLCTGTWVFLRAGDILWNKGWDSSPTCSTASSSSPRYHRTLLIPSRWLHPDLLTLGLPICGLSWFHPLWPHPKVDLVWPRPPYPAPSLPLTNWHCPPLCPPWCQFIHTLESQRTFSARDRAYVASLLTVALHGKLEYFTDILRTLLSDLVAQYVAKNPKLMLRRSVRLSEARGGLFVMSS